GGLRRSQDLEDEKPWGNISLPSLPFALLFHSYQDTVVVMGQSVEEIKVVLTMKYLFDVICSRLRSLAREESGPLLSSTLLNRYPGLEEEGSGSEGSKEFPPTGSLGVEIEKGDLEAVANVTKPTLRRVPMSLSKVTMPIWQKLTKLGIRLRLSDENEDDQIGGDNHARTFFVYWRMTKLDLIAVALQESSDDEHEFERYDNTMLWCPPRVCSVKLLSVCVLPIYTWQEKSRDAETNDLEIRNEVVHFGNIKLPKNLTGKDYKKCDAAVPQSVYDLPVVCKEGEK
ncbi:hypothetical protein ACJX0J_042345, partial [Zea mays]